MLESHGMRQNNAGSTRSTNRIKYVDKQNYVDEEIFAHDDTVKSVKATNSLDEEKDFDVTPLTQDILDKRAY